MGCAFSMEKLGDIFLVLLHPVDAKFVGRENKMVGGGGFNFCHLSMD